MGTSTLREQNRLHAHSLRLEAEHRQALAAESDIRSRALRLALRAGAKITARDLDRLTLNQVRIVLSNAIAVIEEKAA